MRNKVLALVFLTLWIFCARQNFYKLGKSSSERGEYEDAIKYLTLYIESFPESAKAYLERGKVYYAIKEYKKALNDFTKAMELKPGIGYIYFMRGLTYRVMGRCDSAINNFNQAIKYNFSTPAVYYNRAMCYLEKKEFELSLKDINKALKTDSTILSLLHGRAVIYYYLEKPEEVIKDCNKVLDKIDEEENSFLYYAVLGLKLLSEGDYRKSVEYYTKALEIQPDWAGGYSRRGNAYYYAGEIESATRDWEKAHEINPFYPFFPFAKELLKQKRK